MGAVVRQLARVLLVVLSTLLTGALAVAVNVATGGSLPGRLGTYQGWAWPAVAVLVLITGCLAAWEVAAESRRDAVADAADPPVVHVPPTSTVDSGANPAAAPAQIPPDVAVFTGREREITKIEELISRFSEQQQPMIVSISGGPGVGKTTLAIHLANRLRSLCPDAQLYVDLRGTGLNPLSTEPALDGLLRALGCSPDLSAGDLESKVALFRTQMAQRRALLLLDDARSYDQIRQLLTGSPTCIILVTSRHPLGVMAEAVSVLLGLMSEQDSVELLGSYVGRERIDAEPQSAALLARRCGYLPLALSIAGARLRSRPQWSVQDLAERMADERRRLDELRTGTIAVRAAFHLSYEEFDEEHARLFRRLSLLIGSQFGVGVVAAVVGAEEGETERLIEDLVDVHLLEVIAPGRYRMHELVRLFAHERAMSEESEHGREQVASRTLAYYLSEARARHALVGPVDPRVDDQAAPVVEVAPAARSTRRRATLLWFETERHNLTAAMRAAASRGEHGIAWRLMTLLAPFFDMRSYPREWMRLQELAVASARASNDPTGIAITLHDLGDVHRYVGDTDRAVECLHASLTGFRSNGDPLGEGRAHFTLGQLHRERHQSELAESHYARAAELFVPLRAYHDHAEVLIGQAGLRAEQGGLNESAELLGQALGLLRSGPRWQISDDHKEAWAVENLAVVRRLQGELAEAEELHLFSLEGMRELGDRFGEAHALSNLAEVRRIRGRHTDAIEHCAESLDIFGAIGHLWGEAKVRRTLGELEFERHHWTTAVVEFEQSADLYARASDTRQQIDTLRRLADALRHTSDRGRAESVEVQAAELLSTLDATQDGQDDNESHS